MPHRLLPYIPYPKMFLAGLFSGGSSILAAALDDRYIAIGMALVAMGTVLGQPLMRAYGKYRERKREEDKADRQAVTDEYLVVVRSNDERGRMIEQLQAQNGDQQRQIDELKAKLERFAGRAKAAVREVNDKADAALGRLDAVEAQQGSTSNLGLPAQPPEPQ